MPMPRGLIKSRRIFPKKLDEPPHFQLSGCLQLVFVDLSRFKGRELKDLVDIRDLWRYVLGRSRDMSSADLEVLSGKGEEMKMAADRLRHLSEDQELRLWETQRRKARQDVASLIASWEDSREDGREEGLKEGRKEGLQKGRREVVFNMLQKNLEIPLISEVTGMSEREIRELKNGKSE